MYSSSFKFITSKNCPIDRGWHSDLHTAYRQATVREKITFLMHQSVMVNYIDRAYDSYDPSSGCAYDNGALYLIKRFKEGFIWPSIASLKEEFNEGLDNKSYLDMLESIEYLSHYGESVGASLDVKLVMAVLEQFKENVPMVFSDSDNSFYEPYLRFVETTGVTDDLVDIAKAPKSALVSFKVNGEVSVPSFSLLDGLLVVDFDQRMPGYEYDAEKHVELTMSLNTRTSSIMSYLYGYNWSTCTINGFLGTLASMCLELDANLIPRGSIMWMYYFLYRKVFKWNPHVNIWENALRASPSIVTARRWTISMMTAVRSRYNVKLNDIALLKDILELEGEDISEDSLHSYLNAKDASGVSVEMYTGFKRSVFGTFEELDFKKTKRQSLDKLISLQARSDNEVYAILRNAKRVRDLPAYLQDCTFNLEELLVGVPVRKAKNVAGGPYFNADADAGQAGQPPEQPGEKTPEEEGDDTKPDEPDSGDQNPDADPVTMPGGDNTEMEEEDTHTQDQPLPVVSDKRGVRLDLSPNENTDTVLYRFELKAYVDTLLANPPKYLDAQTITYLKKLKAFWWNILSVQTLYHVLNSVVKVPKAYRIKKIKG